MKMQVIKEFIAERVGDQFPIEKEPQITTMEKPVIIESACPGWQMGGKRFPAVPITIADQVKEIVDSIKAGAVAVHIHPRDPKTGNAKVDPLLLKKVMDPIFDQVDCVTLSHTWAAKEEADYISETEKLLEMGKGNKYCQGSVVLPVGFLSSTGAYHSKETVINGVKWLEAHSVKPIYQLYDTYVIWDIKKRLIETNSSTWKPFVFNLNMGKHHSHTIHRDPWSFLQLITNYNIIRETVPDSIIGVYPGGRNWLPILVLGLMLGTQLVRVGIEDCYWVYPHKDEIIKKNSDMVKLTVEIANCLGRRVVTDANEARDILGIKLTS
jgi:uncharacterized protein (DUF849 family)